MGQRHQVYALLPSREGLNGRPTTVIGLHHQWLYGFSAVRGLNRVLDFHKNNCGATNYPKFTSHHTPAEVLECLAAIYALDVEQGTFSTVHPFEGDSVAGGSPELTDFSQGANNDGITIIDFTDGKGNPCKTPKYCFYAFYGTEGKISLTNHRTYSAGEYLLSYYPDRLTHSKDDLSLAMTDMLPKFNGYEVLTIEDVYKIFPKWKRKHPKCAQTDPEHLESRKALGLAAASYSKYLLSLAPPERKTRRRINTRSNTSACKRSQ